LYGDEFEMSAGQFGGKFYWTRLTPDCCASKILKRRRIVFGAAQNEPILIASGFQSPYQIQNTRFESMVVALVPIQNLQHV
jgi:hypothetical protein